VRAGGEDLHSEVVAFNVDDDGFDLFRAALLIGRIEEPELNIEAVSRQVAEIAASVRLRMESAGPWPEPLAVLVSELFGERDFRGDRDEYDAPRNSFLHEVLRTRRGLPITLSLLFIEVARRVGIDAFGIPFPGHFLVGVRGNGSDGAVDVVVVDPFHAGRLRTVTDLERHLTRLAGKPTPLAAEHLMPAEPRSVLERMLYNLRSSYVRRGDVLHLSRVLSRLLILRPRDGVLYLERARSRRLLLDDEGARSDAVAARAFEETEEDADSMVAMLDDERANTH
jgi:regulator of sirC expression with transglutaminase-like and TPR domain